MVDNGECPSCGARMVPALVGDPSSHDPAAETGPLLADSPVRLFCPACVGDETSQS